MQNFVQPGRTMTVAAPYALTSGDGCLVGALFGVAHFDAASGDDVEIECEGVFTLPKTSAQAWTVGVPIYWNNTTKVCTTVSTDNTLIGKAALVAANPSATGRVRLG